MENEIHPKQSRSVVRLGMERPLRDADIRASLTRWLEDQHKNDETTAFYQELAIPRPTARADLAVVNGALVGYEIKSDVDSVARLPMQIRSYGHIFDRMFLVTTERRRAGLIAAVPEWWGVIRATEDGRVKQVRASKLNKNVSCSHVLFLLNIKELIKTINILKLDVRYNLKKSDLVDLIAKKSSKKNILQEVRSRLKERKSSL